MTARSYALASALVLLALVAASWPAGADQRTVRGSEIAQRSCGKCHATGRQGESPHQHVIPFRQLSERYPVEMLTEAARTGVVGGHDEMPMFEFSMADVTALIAYIDSLAPAGSPRYLPARKP